MSNRYKTFCSWYFLFILVYQYFFCILLLQLWSASLLLLIKWNTFISNHSLYLSNYLTRFLFHSWSLVRCTLSISLCDSLWGNGNVYMKFLWIFVHYKLIYTSILTGKCSGLGLEKKHVIFWTFLYSNILNLNSVVFFSFRVKLSILFSLKKNSCGSMYL